ncbi:alpha-1,2-fucosyltransferase [Helicobacter cinaedi]|uniref:alpha-1,2-fucosyltransferase n=1 Tax=Helicobacter cinaedi TaxID=213 RepID=UPI000CF070B5|nr:alpha-1,2-fucosyltransferase [Helicobacter cinaedi]
MRYYLKRMRFVLRGRFSRYPNFYQCYKHICYENLGTEEDFVLKAFLADGFHPHALPWGYFQDLRYMKELDTLPLDFTLIPPLRDDNQIIKQKILRTSSSVFLHIRLGDYLESGTYSRLGVSYYQKALEVMKAKISHPYIFVFSNDIQWCEKYLTQYVDFSGCGVEFVKGNTEGNAAEEMELMRSCQHAIIANSTFSWWAAYLMENPNKIVIMPKYFFNDNKRIPRYDMLALKGWVVIDNVWGTIE